MDRAKCLSVAAVVFLLIGCALLPLGCTRFDRVVDFTADPTSGRRPLSVRFTPLVDGEVRKWVWNFGDGQMSTERSPTHTYANAGTYTVLLTVFPRCADPVAAAKEDYVTVTSGIGGVPLQLAALDDAFNIAEMTPVYDSLGAWFVFDVLANDTSPDPEAQLAILGVRESSQDDYDIACILQIGSGVVRVSTGKLAPAGTRVLFMEHDAGWGLGELTFSYLVSDGHGTAEATVTIVKQEINGHPL